MKFILLFCASLFACVPHQTSTNETGASMLPKQDPTITAAVISFATAADNRDVPALEGLLDESFRVVFTVKGSDEVSTIDRATYLSLLQAGKLGGVTREVRVSQAIATGSLASAMASLASPAALFESEYTLIQRGGKWRLAQDATVFTPRK
jgi:hypothetical protein